MEVKCPGAAMMREAVPEDVICQHCGNELEIWSDEARAKCRKCGNYYVRGLSQSCLDWCAAAEECVGAEALDRYRREKAISESAAP
ncbi:MAG: hypothetical protein AUJ92_06030 [Armatimonadetes bacterium CG2_30_59_28]|nr:hypothetical protein [Armatimonadota bacterium]OIO96433.1 MAG: hypothetical protein AUJ92_06030 [Armatimonadetes bacterium CG2_30_59_28]